MTTVTREKFNVMLRSAPEVDLDAEMREHLVWMADDFLDRKGGRRVSDWTWEEIVEDPGTFGSRMAELRARIGQLWDDEHPEDGIIQAWAVDQIEQGGPEHHQYGWCWAVRA